MKIIPLHSTCLHLCILWHGIRAKSRDTSRKSYSGWRRLPPIKISKSSFSHEVVPAKNISSQIHQNSYWSVPNQEWPTADQPWFHQRLQVLNRQALKKFLVNFWDFSIIWRRLYLLFCLTYLDILFKLFSSRPSRKTIQIWGSVSNLLQIWNAGSIWEPLQSELIWSVIEPISGAHRQISSGKLGSRVFFVISCVLFCTTCTALLLKLLFILLLIWNYHWLYQYLYILIKGSVL